MTGVRWLITGGGGLLGRTIVRMAREASEAPELVITSRQASGDLFLDLGETELVFPKGIDVVLHVAGEKRDETRMEAINHLGTRRLVEAAAQSGVRRFVYVSSVGVYGAAPHSGVVTESFPHTPRNCYEASKNAGELCVLECCSRFGMEAVILQPSTVIAFAPDTSYPLLTLMKMIRRDNFVWFGRASPCVNYVAVEDVAAAVVKAADKAPSGQTFIVNTPERLSEVVRWISEELGVPMPRRRLPLWVGQAVAGLGSTVSRLAGRSMPINRERLLELTNTTRYDGTALMKATGFDYPLGIEAAIRQLAQHYVQEGLL